MNHGLMLVARGKWTHWTMGRTNAIFLVGISRFACPRNHGTIDWSIRVTRCDLFEQKREE